MKKILLQLMLILFLPIAIIAQTNQLEIHHINIGNGDCSIIILKDNTGAVISRTIIDGGNANYTTYLGPYITQELGNNTRFNLLVLSHFHKDHYNGLLGLDNGTINADLIVDGGFYELEIGEHNDGLEPPNQSFPPPRAPRKWEDNISDFGNNINNNAIRAKRVDSIPQQIKNGIILGTINGVQVQLFCIAGNGSNIASINGQLGVRNNIINGRNNQNNYSIGWLLVFGKFRYYTAGDIGGRDANYTQNIPYYNNTTINITGSCGGYTNQETDIAGAIALSYPNAQPYNGVGNHAGHVCGVKMSHHGSACSNNPTWLNTLRPTVFFTSVGGNNSWKLPKLNTLYNMRQVPPMSDTANFLLGIYKQGYYFTNLYNFAGNGHDSRRYADSCFSTRAATSYNYGNDNPNTNGSYVLIVPAGNIANVSEFTVYRVNCPLNNVQRHTFMGRFLCHQ